MLYDSFASSSTYGQPTMMLKDGTTFTDGKRVSTVDVLEIQVGSITDLKVIESHFFELPFLCKLSLVLSYILAPLLQPRLLLK